MKNLRKLFYIRKDQESDEFPLLHDKSISLYLSNTNSKLSKLRVIYINHYLLRFFFKLENKMNLKLRN